jgi:hypothetical protein
MAIDFTAKLGPLPVYGWGIIGGGVIAVGAYFLNRGGGTEISSATLSADGYQTTGIKMSTDVKEEPSTYDTNTAWLSRTSRQIAAELGKSYVEVQAALWKFLRGETLTASERGLVDTAISRGGTPPEGVEGSSAVTPDKPNTVKSPVAATSYVATRDSSVYTSLVGTKVAGKVAKGARVNVVVGGSPTRYRILRDGGTFAYVPRSNFRKV